eukprot:529985-Pelagomonas_calceolata.AAC.5
MLLGMLPVTVPPLPMPTLLGTLVLVRALTWGMMWGEDGGALLGAGGALASWACTVGLPSTPASPVEVSAAR